MFTFYFAFSNVFRLGEIGKDNEELERTQM